MPTGTGSLAVIQSANLQRAEVEGPVGASERAPAVLTEALVKAARILGVTQARIGQALGLSGSTVSRMFDGRYRLDPRSKEWELSTLLVRMFRSLDSIVGADDSAARAWLKTDHRSLGGAPIDLIRSAEGLVRVVQYLDAARGRN
jgi:hypothetical protein